ncbi:MAG TPA: efflux RND transporter periplasmic adaptor subunit [Hyphomonadaceae bacterium]|nr:efflux RND transporter periplasmic adaptor subunit [Hyphomonadaceae bacterium]
MALTKRNYVIAAAALAVLAIGGAAVMATNQQPASAKSEQAASADGKRSGAPGGQHGPGGQGGPGAGGKGPGGQGGGPGGRGGVTQVDAAAAAPHPFASRIEGIGTLEPRERVVLTANAADRVTGVFFEDGQRVAKGKVLMTLVNDEENAQLETAKATLDNAKDVYERNKRLAANDAIAQLDLEKAKATYDAAEGSVQQVQARLRDRILLAPFSGVLGFRQISMGAYVSPGQPVATLIDDSLMRLEFGVPSLFLKDVHPGLSIHATTADLPGRDFEGQVTSIDNAIDPVTRAVKVRATLPNKDGALRAGTFMSVNLLSKTRNSLSIPEISVIAEGSKTFVYVVDQTRQPAVAVKTEIQIGVREKGFVEVVSGLKSGDMVVTDGVLKLRPNAPVRIKSAGGGAAGPSGQEGTEKVASGEGPSDRAGLRQ